MSLLYGFRMVFARDLVTLEVKTGETIVRGMFVGKDGSNLAVVATDAAGYTFVGIAASKPYYSKRKHYVKVFTKGKFKFAATSITAPMEGSAMYVKTSTSFDDTSNQSVAAGTLVKRLSATSGWLNLNVAPA